MFCVNVALGNLCWRFLYKDEDTAKGVFEAMQHPNHDTGTFVTDDFGQTATLKAGSITAFMLEDMDKSKLANVELFLHQQRVQAMAQKAAQADPGLRANSLMNGPAMLSPMGGMPRN